MTAVQAGLSPSCRGSVAGVDEVGRGCLFGPVVAAAVVLSETAGQRLAAEGLTDSKQLSPRRRGLLLPRIEALAEEWSLGQASAAEIDRDGIRPATERAMLRALSRLHQPPQLVLVDGSQPLRGWEGRQRCLVGGDRQKMAIAAASVIAKQYRDGLVTSLARRYPGYGFERHVGYATAVHRAALLERGPTPLHRLSFLNRLMRRGPRWMDHPAEPIESTSTGNRAAADGPHGP